MSKYLIIAGHGKNRDGSFDPGATGFIKRGEHRYMVEVLFPAMEKYADKRFIFYTERNVYNYGNIVSLANKHNASVIEIHFDAAGNSKASGGHVIINQAFKADAMDLRLRDALKNTIGIFGAYKHRGELGISGRSDLANVNRTGRAGINYRLVELGFGTNKHDSDYMMNHADKLAKALVEAIIGAKATSKPSKPSSKPAQKPKRKTDEQLADEVMAGLHGAGEARKRSLGTRYDAVQAIVNKRYGVKSKAQPKRKSAEQLADEVMAGKHGSGEARKKSLGSRYDEVQAIVNKRYGVKDNKKSLDIESLAKQVYRGIDNQGRRIPNGVDARAKHFGISRSEMQKVQSRVNQMYGK